MAKVTALNEAGFDEAIGKANAALVDFWAPWCGPCRALSATIEDVAEKYDGRVEAYKVNVDENPQLSERFRVMSIPTVILFCGGEKAAKLTGVQPEDAYIDMIEENLI